MFYDVSSNPTGVRSQLAARADEDEEVGCAPLAADQDSGCPAPLTVDENGGCPASLAADKEVGSAAPLASDEGFGKTSRPSLVIAGQTPRPP